MYCYKCGKEIQEGSTFCPECGANQKSAQDINNSANQQSSGYTYAGMNTNQMPYQNQMPNQNQIMKASYNVMAVVGFVISIISLFLNFWGLVGIAGTVVSTVGLVQCKNNNENGRALAIVGIVIGVISIIYGLYVLFALSYMFDIFYDLL